MKSFKQFLQEDKEFEPWKYVKYYDAKEAKALPEFDWEYAEDAYKVDNILFDAKRGIGAVPWNQEIHYVGFIAQMYPKDFLTLAADYDKNERDKKSNEIISHMREGAALAPLWLKMNISTNFLDKKVQLKPENEAEKLMWEYDWYRKEKNQKTLDITGHEGRGRAIAIQKLYPNTLIPVQVIVQPGEARLVNKNLDTLLPAFKDSIKSEKGFIVNRPFKHVLIDGKKYSV